MAHHAQRQFTIPCGEVTAQEFHFGEFTLDQSRYRLQRGERQLRLEKLPMELLILLVQRRGELVSREEIADRLGAKIFLSISITALTRLFARSVSCCAMIRRSLNM